MELRIGELRKSLGLTLQGMSVQTGVSINSLHQYERGQIPTILQIEKIAGACGVSPAWLVGWSDERGVPEPGIVEKVVYVEVDKGRLPPYWNNDHEGQLIYWK